MSLATDRVRRLLTKPFLATLAALFLCAPVPAQKLNLPPEVKQALAKMYGGDPDTAIKLASRIEKARPEHPLGYLLEAEARWWKIYCAACEVKWDMVDAWKQPKKPGDDEYLTLANHAIHLAEAQIQKSDSAEMRLYAGIGWALKARLYGLRDERHATAHAGVKAREQLLQAIQLDANLADAYTGLGLYNYYVDTLSPIVKMLRFLSGIPGGSKKEGIAQLERAMSQGELTAVEARFYLAKNLRTYDHEYERAFTIAAPLIERYPHNPLFLLLVGNLSMELGRKENAVANFNAAHKLAVPDPVCAARVQQLVQTLLSTLH
jgi:tetratricopeptide (TPR) repeat protein